MTWRPRRDAHAHLLRALLAQLGLAPEQIIASAQTPWASATFSGARHEVSVSLAGQQADAIAALESHEFDLPGHLVADLRATRIDTAGAPQLHIEALTIAGG